MNVNWKVMVPLFAYLVGIYALAYYSWNVVSRARQGSGYAFMSEFFLADRQLGGFLLAMTLVATYVSAGSFIGGPGTAYVQGLGWVFLAMAQMPTGYLTLTLLGKKFAIVARKVNALSVVDFLRERYRSHVVVVISCLAIVGFVMASMTAQWVGAARVMQAAGLTYEGGLALFAITVLVYVTAGGYRAVALTDALQGAVMLIGTAAILIGTVVAGGGVSNIVRSMYRANPELITPFGVKGFLSPPWVCSYWVLVGLGLAGLPQVAVRAMSYKDSMAMHRAIVIGTPVACFLMLGMHLTGAFASAVVPGVKAGDLVIPTVTVKVLPEWIGGVFLAAPLAAIMSTVDSMVILVSTTIVKDLYLNYVDPSASSRRVSTLSTVITALTGIVVFFASLKPPALLVWLNLFALGGLEAVFFWPIVLGLYWKRGNAPGAIASMATGVVTYMLFDKVWKRPFGTHTIVLPLALALVAFIGVSLVTAPPPEDVVRKFWE
ncbi:MAG: sodium/pantothenate symporter [Bacillota bacterium]